MRQLVCTNTYYSVYDYADADDNDNGKAQTNTDNPNISVKKRESKTAEMRKYQRTMIAIIIYGSDAGIAMQKFRTPKLLKITYTIFDTRITRFDITRNN